MAGRLQTNHLIPGGVVSPGFDRLSEVAPTIGVHGTVQIDRRHTLAVGLENAVDVGPLGDTSTALIVNDYIKVAGPAVAFVDRKPGVHGGVGVVDHLDRGMYPGLNSLFEQLRLRGVVMAATTRHDQHL